LRATLIIFAAFVPIAAIVVVSLNLVGASRLWPAGLLIVTSPLEVYRSSSSAGANVSLFRLALAVAAVKLAIDLLRKKKRLRRAVPVAFACYGALVGWQLVSLIFVTSNHSLAYRFIGQYGAGLVAAYIVTRYVERRDLRVAVGLWGGAAILPLLAGAFRVFSVSRGGSGNLPGLSELPLNLTIEAARQSGSALLDGTQRMNATFSDPNQFGFYIATVLVALAGMVCVCLFAEKNRDWSRTLSYLLLTLASAVATVGSYSRGAWLLAFVGTIVLASLVGRAFWTRGRIVTASVAVAAALGLASPLIASRLGSSEAGNAKSTQVHEHTMSKAVSLVEQHPAIGVGLGGFGRYADQPPLISSATSTFLTTAAELGVPGLLLLLCAIGVTAFAAVRHTVRCRLEDRTLLAGFVAAFIGLAIANVIGEAWMDDFQWVLFGLVLALTQQPVIRLPFAMLKRKKAGDRGGAVTGAPQGAT
jgi:hypothetical protein